MIAHCAAVMIEIFMYIVIMLVYVIYTHTIDGVYIHVDYLAELCFSAVC
jgi:hypothetical protein